VSPAGSRTIFNKKYGVGELYDTSVQKRGSGRVREEEGGRRAICIGIRPSTGPRGFGVDQFISTRITLSTRDASGSRPLVAASWAGSASVLWHLTAAIAGNPAACATKSP